MAQGTIAFEVNVPPGVAGPAGPAGVAGPAGAAGLAPQFTGSSSANMSFSVLPANAFILFAMIRETAGKAVSIGLGTSSGATDVLGLQTVAAGSGLMVPIGAFTTSWFGPAQPLFISSPGWGGASVNLTLVYMAGP